MKGFADWMERNTNQKAACVIICQMLLNKKTMYTGYTQPIGTKYEWSDLKRYSVNELQQSLMHDL